MRQDNLIQHIWTRNQYAVMARSRNIGERIRAMVAADPPLVADAIQLIAEAMAGSPTRNGWTDALEQAWTDLRKSGLKEGYKRQDFVNACKDGQESARRFLFEAASASGHQHLMSSSLLDDTPLPGFAFYQKGKEWWQVREKNGRLSSLPVNGLLSRASSSARRDAVLQGEGILRRVAGTVYPDPRFAPLLRSRGLWNEAWPEVTV